MTERDHVLIIGAGIGGLTAGALLLKEGFRVTVLEAHVYPGGSAGTFYHQGYRFDAGATLAAGFGPDGPHTQVGERLGISWPVTALDPAWVVHLPGGRRVHQWASREAWAEERRRHFPGSEQFWRKQEMLAKITWDLAGRALPWPPQNLAELARLAASLRPGALRATPYLLRDIADIAHQDDPAFSLFLDGQLLISAQTTAADANALYGSAALDLPRRGVNHVHGGMGNIARTLSNWIEENGGTVRYRQQVERIELEKGRARRVYTNKRLVCEFDWLVANVTPWSLVRLLGDGTPKALRRESERTPTWGAFTLYLGLDAARLPTSDTDALHHQVLSGERARLGEGNSLFLSLSPAGDESRAPAGKRAATLSTHTRIEPWWELRHGADEEEYLKRRDAYTNRLLELAEVALPGISAAAELILPGTPVTFAFYTRRAGGMVGGFPQTSLFQSRGPDTGIPNLKLVGDSIFPGQSTAGVTLGAIRVVRQLLQQSGAM